MEVPDHCLVAHCLTNFAESELPLILNLFYHHNLTLAHCVFMPSGDLLVQFNAPTTRQMVVDALNGASDRSTGEDMVR
jgi:hypothetical protein